MWDDLHGPPLHGRRRAEAHSAVPDVLVSTTAQGGKWSAALLDGVAVDRDIGEPAEGLQRHAIHLCRISHLAEELAGVRIVAGLLPLVEAGEDHGTGGLDVVPGPHAAAAQGKAAGHATEIAAEVITLHIGGAVAVSYTHLTLPTILRV